MKITKIFIISVIALMISNNLLEAEIDNHDYTGERILYRISPFGKAEYKDLGVVEINGIKLNVVTFKAKVLFLEDKKTIYCHPESLLPYRIERTVSKLWMKEHIIEEYDQEKFKVVVKKFKGAKLVDEQITQANGPIQNAILLPFYLRRGPDLKIGLQFTIRVPEEFKVGLVSIDEITIPAGTFQACHFKSIPEKFEVWINKDAPRVPVKIQGEGICTLLMKKYSHRNN